MNGMREEYEKRYGYDGFPAPTKYIRKIYNISRSLADTSGPEDFFRLVDIPKETLEDCADRVEEEHPELDEDERNRLTKAQATNKWLADNTLDFYDEVEQFYRIVEHFHERASDQVAYTKLKEEFKDYQQMFPKFNNGFPQGFNYRIKTGKTYDKINGSAYVNLSMVWLENQLHNPEIFPETAADPFPERFVEIYLSEMFKRLYRIWVLIFGVCWPAIEAAKVVVDVNEAFKHFYFFAKRYNLLEQKGDRDILMKTKVKAIMNFDQLDQEYSQCQQELR